MVKLTLQDVKNRLISFVFSSRKGLESYEFYSCKNYYYEK